VALVAVGAAALVVVSGGSDADPRTPPALPGMPPPFLGTAVAGGGGMTAAVDAYGDVVDLRTPGPAGRELIDNPADRQAAGTVSPDTGIVPRVRIDFGSGRPLWRADSISQRYLPGTNVVRTVARFGRVRATVTTAASNRALAETLEVTGPSGQPVVPTFGADLIGGSGARCDQGRRAGGIAIVCSAGASLVDEGSSSVAIDADQIILASGAAGRAWVSRARPLGPAAPAWARRMYARSLLTLRALTDRRSGAVVAGARDGWAYVWPRDAGTAALAFAAAGYRADARGVARFLLGLNLDAAARFEGDGAPVPGRGPQGDADGWVAVAARAGGLPFPRSESAWRDRPDYQEGAPADYLANAIASSAAGADGPIRAQADRSKSRSGPASISKAFGSARGLVRRAGDPGSGLDSAAAWAVRPFPQPALLPAIRRTLLSLADRQTRFGITPGEKWPGADPWSAPTAWTAWSLAALGERRQALRLLGDLRRAATPAGAIPERVDAATGVPRSTTPLAWSHAFVILALRQLWPGT
jgi:hypothetical protein